MITSFLSYPWTDPSSVERRARGDRPREEAAMNRGVGGPLLCIGDLLSDVGGRGGEHQSDTPSSSSPSSPSFHLPPTSHPLPPSHLHRLFQVTPLPFLPSRLFPYSPQLLTVRFRSLHLINQPVVHCQRVWAAYGIHAIGMGKRLYVITVLRNRNLLLCQENHDKLNEALKGTSDHSWTALTLKLCATLETADKLLQSANTNVEMLAEKIGELESIMKRGDAAVATARAVLRKETKEQPTVKR
ncbi:hypothetical protein ACLOJK_016560 [Asimina triloba]